MRQWISHLTFLAFIFLTCKTRNLGKNVCYSLSALWESRINNNNHLLKACHEPGSLLHILSAWPHLILTRIPRGWYDCSYLRERHWGLESSVTCPRTGSEWNERIWTPVCGTPSPGAQCCSIRKNVRAKPPRSCLPGKTVSPENKTYVQAEAVSGLFFSVTTLQEAGWASWSACQLSQSQGFTLGFSISP